MYNVVDTYFAGLISTQTLAAMSLSLSVFFIIIAMGSGFSTGSTALIANALGAGDREKARLFSVQAIVLGILLSVILTVIGLTVSPSLFSMLGASEAYLEISLKYMDTIFLGTLFFVLQYMFNSVLNAMGDTKSMRNWLMAGFVLNIALDPWFIFGGLGLPAMGITGIALATVLIQLFGSIYLGIKVYKTGLIKRLSFNDMIPKINYFKEIARQGFPASANMFTIGIGIFVITYFISVFGKEAVAAYGIAMRIEQIVLIPTIGLNVATLTIVAQNNGAGYLSRIKETLIKALRLGGMVMTIGTLCVYIFSESLMGIFTDDAGVVELGALYLKIDALVLYAYVILMVNIATLQGIKKPMFAVWIGLLRQIVAPFTVFYLLTRVLDLGLMSIFWGIFSITWFAALFSLFYVRVVLRKVMDSPEV